MIARAMNLWDDTDLATRRFQIQLLREAGSTKRAELALSLSRTVVGLSRRAIRRAMPDADERLINLRFVELHYGTQLAEGLRRFLDSHDS